MHIAKSHIAAHEFLWNVNFAVDTNAETQCLLQGLILVLINLLGLFYCDRVNC